VYVVVHTHTSIYRYENRDRRKKQATAPRNIIVEARFLTVAAAAA
jgi:hypothetical protein